GGRPAACRAPALCSQSAARPCSSVTSPRFPPRRNASPVPRSSSRSTADPIRAPRGWGGGALEPLQVPAPPTLTRGTIIKIGQLVGAATVVTGRLEFDGDAMAVHAAAIRIDTGGVGAAFAERGPLNDLLATIERVARRLLPASTVPSAVVEQQHPPLAALDR